MTGTKSDNILMNKILFIVQLTVQLAFPTWSPFLQIIIVSEVFLRGAQMAESWYLGGRLLIEVYSRSAGRKVVIFERLCLAKYYLQGGFLPQCHCIDNDIRG